MERRFGRDFSTVRVHTDAQAAESAEALGARAYTVGNNLFFASGQYAPSRADGQILLAHELVHSIQQRFAPPPRSHLKIESTDSSAERQAVLLAQLTTDDSSSRSRSAVGFAQQSRGDAPTRNGDNNHDGVGEFNSFAGRIWQSIPLSLQRAVTGDKNAAPKANSRQALTCPDDVFEQLRQEQKDACVGGRNCSGMSDIEGIRWMMAKRMACYQARWKLMKKCYGGGDLKHEQFLVDELHGFYNCKERLEKVQQERTSTQKPSNRYAYKPLDPSFVAFVLFLLGLFALLWPIPTLAVAAIAILAAMIRDRPDSTGKEDPSAKVT
jgi:hypothetical protein